VRALQVISSVLVVAAGCGKKPPALAELIEAAGPVERQAASGPWQAAALGTRFFLGDAARTGDGSAGLEIVGGAHIAMQPHTVLRFGGAAERGQISIETGAIDLSGTGSYLLDVGDVRLSRNGTVRITAEGDGKSSIRLRFGEAQVATLAGQTVDLVLDVPLELGLGDAVAVPLIDAGVAIADAMVAEIDAATGVEPDDETVAIDITGTRAELQLPGEASWRPLPAGASRVVVGARIRTGSGTRARLVAGAVTLELGGGSRVAVGGVLALEAGSAEVATTAAGSVRVPGGAVAMVGQERAPVVARLEGDPRGTKVTSQRGGATLTGLAGSELVLARGESATVMASGVIRPLEAIPRYFDLRIGVGETVTIHDPRPPTAIQFVFPGTCGEGGVVELDRDPRFVTAKISAGKEAANHLVRPGTWRYRLRCTTGAREGGAVVSGRIAVVADAGTRRLPSRPGVNPFDVDGRPWTFAYQSVIPDLAVKFPGTGSRFRLHLARGGKDLTFESTSNRLVVPGPALSEGKYTYWFDRDGVKQDKVNQLAIVFDQTAPQVYIEQPGDRRPWGGGDIEVRGAVLPGWTAAVEGITIPIDATRRFSAKVGAPAGRALAIRLSHPQRGVHYYLRREK
jgi:hypothetical protein